MEFVAQWSRSHDLARGRGPDLTAGPVDDSTVVHVRPLALGITTTDVTTAPTAYLVRPHGRLLVRTTTNIIPMHSHSHIPTRETRSLVARIAQMKRFRSSFYVL